MNKENYLSDADMDAMHDSLDQRDKERLIMTTLYQPFEADAEESHINGGASYNIKISACNDQMCIHATEENIYITKAQAMAFFGLVDPYEAHTSDFSA